MFVNTVILIFLYRKENLNLQEILALLDEDPPNHPTDVVLMPSEDTGGLTDEDSENEDSGEKDPNHFGKGILNQQAGRVSNLSLRRHSS